MADLYQPVVWVDGQQLTAANSANRWEQGIETLDNECDDLRNAVSALQASGGGGGTGTAGPLPSGPSSSRPSPTIGLLYYDTTLGYVILGTGTSWVNVDGTAITTGGGGGPAPGTSTAPQNMTAVVNPDNSIDLSWSAVAGASAYTVRETESPNGVSGMPITTTSSHRTPGTMRNYDYWVTATVGGVESAASNHVFPVLPYSGGGTTPPPSSSDPSTFLNINGKGTGTGGWWNLGIGFASGHTDITPTQLQNGYVNSPYYTMNATGTAVQHQVFLNGGTTSTNTKYPRCEFREFATGSTSTKASWSGSSGRHIMRGAVKLLHLGPNKPEVVVAQMHDSADDTLQLGLYGTSASGPFDVKLRINGTLTGSALLTGVALGTEVAWDIDVNNGTLTVKINGTTKYTGNPGWGGGQYFKTPLYPQQNVNDSGNPSTEYARVEFRNLFVSHA